MIELVFLTSNRIKLAHLRYLAKEYDVSIISHKQIHYGRSYIEPRLFEREELLRQSMTDALIRWRKRIPVSENRFYFIEDTSVKIHALSTASEVPGVDVKHWMQDITFNKLDDLLRAGGNNRSVTVYSHMGLLLGQRLEEAMGAPYMFFTSNTSGTVVDREISFESHILYPWLDNKSFNKWFVPSGASLPMSLLPILEATKSDFRRPALEQLITFVKKHAVKKFAPKKPNYLFGFKPNFIICGPTCAGKTTIGKYLVDNFGYFHLEASDFMTMEYWETHGLRSNIKLGNFAKEILIANPHVVCDRLLAFMENLENVQGFVITGFRSPEEVKFFRVNARFSSEIKLIFLDADQSIRYQRWQARNRDVSDKSEKIFSDSNAIQDSMGLQEIRKISNCSEIRNEKNLECFFDEFTKIHLTQAQLNEYDQRTHTPNGLEDTILHTMAVIYDITAKKLLTTTEISYEIESQTQTVAKTKHKDNISRYFNQKYYPYYEAKFMNGRNLYALSPTGYSMAQHIKRLKRPKSL